MGELDGNSAAGLLLEIFGREMTANVATCASCGAVAPLAESGSYASGMGTVIRCRGCDGVLMVITANTLADPADPAAQGR